jgi:tetrahydromethanopterin S-methyltransferase subunit C
VKKADKPNVVIIYGDNNKVSYGGTGSQIPAIAIIAFGFLIAIAVLAVSLCCPDLLAEFVRWIISKVIGG